jgi:hypothetical protein
MLAEGRFGNCQWPHENAHLGVRTKIGFEDSGDYPFTRMKNASRQ